MSENYKYLGISDETLEQRITEAIAGLALTREDRIPRIFTIVKEVEWDNEPDVDVNEIFVEIVPWFTGEDEDSGDPNDDSIAIHCDEITTVDTFGEMKSTIHEFIRSMNNEIHDMAPDYSDRTEPCLSLAEIEKALLDRYGYDRGDRSRGCHAWHGGWLSVEDVLNTIKELC